ncbi:MAG TPA: hypothetical protein VK190_04705 [Pseudoneobacillus sp.]|nr:hypothetical protein [Pseudoneobacillus sp.]
MQKVSLKLSLMTILEEMGFEEYARNVNCYIFERTDNEAFKDYEIIVQLNPLTIEIDICINDEYEETRKFTYKELNEVFKMIALYYS